MYSVLYFRKDAVVADLRFFRNLEEFNEWLEGMFELKEEYYIRQIKYVKV